jgi:hypothetical protein
MHFVFVCVCMREFVDWKPNISKKKINNFINLFILDFYSKTSNQSEAMFFFFFISNNG